MPSLAPPTVRAAEVRVKPHSSVALDALRRLENRESSASINTLTLHPPPRPVARRKRPFLLPPSLPAPPPRASTPAVVLDGFVLLQTCRVEDPEEAQKAVLEGAGISAVVTEDMPFFNKLTHLDLGDNNVQLESLGYLPQLQELHLDCNGLCSLTVPTGGFPNLEVLNLSFNGLSAAAILALADIPRLRDLDLSHNELSALPASLARFTSLESLNLEHNYLGSEGAWLSLSSAPSLLALTLAHNRATALPASAAEGFAVLQSLSVAHNRIEHESDLLPVMQLEELEELVVYGNPFVQHGRVSIEFHDDLTTHRRVALATLPPPPPPLPSKLDPRRLARVPEMPSRRPVQLSKPRRTLPAAAAAADPRSSGSVAEAALAAATAEEAAAAAEAGAEEVGPAFFLTAGLGEPEAGGGAGLRSEAPPPAGDGTAPELADEWEAGLLHIDPSEIDMRTAVHALRHALRRPDADETIGSAHHLRPSAATLAKRRDKHMAAPLSRFAAGTYEEIAAAREGAQLDGMHATVSALQQQLADAEARVGAKGPPSDQCMSSLVNMLTAMQGVGPPGMDGSGAAPTQPSAA